LQLESKVGHSVEHLNRLLHKKGASVCGLERRSQYDIHTDNAEKVSWIIEMIGKEKIVKKSKIAQETEKIVQRIRTRKK
jgi:hypothetical protein